MSAFSLPEMQPKLEEIVELFDDRIHRHVLIEEGLLGCSRVTLARVVHIRTHRRSTSRIRLWSCRTFIRIVRIHILLPEFRILRTCTGVPLDAKLLCELLSVFV